MNRQIVEDVFNRGIPWEALKNKTVLIAGVYGMLASYMVYVTVM